LKRELTQAIQEKAHAVILELNTPGGLESSMREMTQSMLNAKIPIIVYVTPHGARAASAGMFITIAANVAAMAPGTNICAAHPVSIGSGGEQKPDEIMKEKVVSDAAAFARAIAKERGRNVTWVEQAVRGSDSAAAHEALKARVIDLIATDLKELLGQLNGRTVVLPSGSITLQTRDIQLVKKLIHLPEKILQVITDPNIAYLLVTIGFIGIIAELYSLGLYFPGVTGVISLLLGFAAMGSLPIGWAELI
jgi:membrane-bound serine protease (ClpP class)